MKIKLYTPKQLDKMYPDDVYIGLAFVYGIDRKYYNKLARRALPVDEDYKNDYAYRVLSDGDWYFIPKAYVKEVIQ